MLPPLKCISILLCERVYRIAGTPGHVIIINAFHHLTMSKFPCKCGSMTVLYTVTDGHGEYAMTLSLSYAESGHEVGQWTVRQRMDNPLVVADVQLILNDVSLPAPGKYLFDLKCEGEPIASRPFYVMVEKRPDRTRAATDAH